MAEDEGDGLYEVEKVVGVKNLKSGKRLFKVKWHGFDDPKDEVCLSLLASFLERLPSYLPDVGT